MTADGDVSDLLERLQSTWSAESSSKWRPENPARGQCSVTALLINDILGGEILRTNTPEEPHFYNRVAGRRLDFTSSEFEQAISYDDLSASRQEAFSDTTASQYEALKRRFHHQSGTP